MNIFNKIIEDQQLDESKYNKSNMNDKVLQEVIGRLNKNEIDKIDNNNNNQMQTIEDNKKDDNEEIQLKENTYENILNEMQEHEIAMEKAIKSADELANATKESIMYYLNIHKPNKHGILFNGVPDVLNASARLLDLSISGRYKLASMKKLRASIIKDSKDTGSNTEFNLFSILNEG